MLSVGEGVWVAFKHDSVIRLFHATSFTHMQDLDVAPSIHKILGNATLSIILSFTSVSLYL